MNMNNVKFFSFQGVLHLMGHPGGESDSGNRATAGKGKWFSDGDKLAIMVYLLLGYRGNDLDCMTHSNEVVFEVGNVACYTTWVGIIIGTNQSDLRSNTSHLSV